MKFEFEIKDVWQILIDVKTMQRIRQIAIKRKTTLSWVVRYCTFKYISSRPLIWNKKAQELFDATNPNRRKKLDFNFENKWHRLQLCLYGSDIRTLQITALQMDITVSDLVRMAIQNIIDELTSIPPSNTEWYWKGIKLIANYLPSPGIDHSKIMCIFWEFIPFAKEDYKYMKGTIAPQSYYTPLAMQTHIRQREIEQLGIRTH